MHPPLLVSIPNPVTAFSCTVTYRRTVLMQDQEVSGGLLDRVLMLLKDGRLGGHKVPAPGVGVGGLHERYPQLEKCNQI